MFIFKPFDILMSPEGDDHGAGNGDAGKAGDGDAGKAGAGEGDAGKAGDGGSILSSQKSGDGDAGKAGDSDAGAGKDEGAGKDGVWSWGENVAGTGEVPPWFKADKYKDVAAQAQAASELEAKLGPAADLIGAPDGDYVLPDKIDGVEGEWDKKDPMLVAFQEVAKEQNLSQKLHDTIVAKMAGLLARENDAAGTTVAEALGELGPDHVQRIQQVETFLVSAIGQESFDAIDGAIGTDVKAYQALEKLAGLAGTDAQLSSLPGKRGVGFTQADIDTERYKVYPEGHKLAGKEVYVHDKEHRAKIDRMYKQLFPGEDIKVVG